MNVLKNLIAQRPELVASARYRESRAADLTWLIEELDLGDLTSQLQEIPFYESLLVSSGLAVVPADSWFSNYGKTQQIVKSAASWFEFVGDEETGWGFIIPNDSSPESRISVFSGLGPGTAWIAFTTRPTPTVLGVGFAVSHCGPVGDGRCAAYSCPGPCELVEVLEPPGARRCQCIPHRL